MLIYHIFLNEFKQEAYAETCSIPHRSVFIICKRNSGDIHMRPVGMILSEFFQKKSSSDGSCNRLSVEILYIGNIRLQIFGIMVSDRQSPAFFTCGLTCLIQLTCELVVIGKKPCNLIS